MSGQNLCEYGLAEFLYADCLLAEPSSDSVRRRQRCFGRNNWIKGGGRMKAGKLAGLAMLTALALVIFVVELQIPNPFPIPGVKLGLAKYHHCLRCLPLPGAGGFPPCFHPHPLGAFFLGI